MQLRQPTTTRQSGFSVIEVLLVVLVVAVLAVTSFVVYQRHKPSNAATGSTQTTTHPKNTATTQPAQPADRYPGWKSAELTDEKLGFRYPSDWTATIIKNSENIAIQSPVTNGHY